MLVRKANQEGGWIGYLENLETFSLNLENQKSLFLQFKSKCGSLKMLSKLQEWKSKEKRNGHKIYRGSALTPTSPSPSLSLEEFTNLPETTT